MRIPRSLVYTFASDDSPSFSPDGRTIAFVRRYAEGVNSPLHDQRRRIELPGRQARCADGRDRVVARRSHDRLLLRAGRRDPSDRRRRNETNEALWPRTGGPNQDAPSWYARQLPRLLRERGVWAARADGKRVAVASSSLRETSGGLPSVPKGPRIAIRRTRIDGRRRCGLAGGPRWIEPSAESRQRERQLVRRVVGTKWSAVVARATWTGPQR
jgi:Tol biopolymer transport system component